MKNFLASPLEGIITPMITPLLDDNHLDFEGLKKLTNHLITGGVHGIFILGTTGECTNISYAVRSRLIRETCLKVDGAVPVLVGISDTSMEESISLAKIAHQAGAQAVVAAPPYYFGLGEAELLDYYKKLAEALPLPLFLYNMPSHTKTMLSQKVVVELSKHPNIIGLKDSSGNAVYFNSMVYAFRNQPDFSLLVGPEEMMVAAVLMGGHGGVSGGSNMFPKLYVDLYQATRSGDLQQMAQLQEMVMEISSELYALGTYGSSYLKGLKAALSILEISNGYLATPMSAFEEEILVLIREKLTKLQAYHNYRTK
ncbi:MAG: dihydrodipicolinate synthase family protein [Cyclobacteriaceae bacterium]